MRDFSIVILVGGKGERVRKITNGLSKSEIILNKKNRIIDYQLNQISKLKKNIIFLSNIKFKKLKKNILKKYKKLNIKFIEEGKKRLGTAGSLKILSEENYKYFIIIFGDLLFNFNFKKLINFHKKKSSDCTLVVHPNSHPKDSDCLKLNDDQMLIKFYKKPHKSITPNLCLSGISIINRKVLNLIKANRTQDFSKFLIPKIQKKKFKIFGYNSREYIKDVGTFSRIREAKNDLKSIKYTKGNINKKIPAIFLDRDGVINLDQNNGKYQNPDKIINKVPKAIKIINSKGFLCVLITNQPSIAKGYITLSKLKNDFISLENKLSTKGAYIDRIYFCPHHPDKGFKNEIKNLKINCNCRKPKNGLILRAIKDLNIDRKRSYFIGDRYTDYLAAKKTKLKFIYVGKYKYKNFQKKENLYKAVRYIFRK